MTRRTLPPPGAAGRVPHALVLAALSAGLLAAAGCAALSDMGKALLPSDRPAASVVGARVHDLSLQAVSLTLDVAITNPYSVELPLTALDYRISSGGTQLLSGRATPAAPLAAASTTELPVTVTLPFTDLLTALSGVKPGAVVPWSAAVDIALDAPVVGPLKLPLQTSGELPVPAVPDVSLAGLRWTELSLTAATGTLDLDLRNTNSFPIDLRDLGFGLSLGGAQVAQAALQPTGSLQPQASRRLQIPISLAPSSLGLAALNLLKGESASYALDGSLDVDTPFGPLHAPFTRAGKVPLSR